ncbi:hypothetical protein J2857_002797 [Neorhizobium galegae]|uniref:hypothetical protein n=1 Tax=Neorhizobium galegae TaxID=399 RepID=UPI001AE57CDC|nr:hypothetical protein [Neorhizobium galegae]MBP2560028.1 hypothetical protein [Neorhizobium galegae]
MNKAMLKSEPPARGARFMVGRDSSGRWIVSDREGRIGGLFTDRASAVHFAMFESDHVPGAVCCVPEEVTLSLGPIFETPVKAPKAISTRMKIVGRA